MDAARKFVDKGQIDKAVKEYLRIVQEDPKDVRIWLKIGDLYAKKNAKQDAIETYLKVARFYHEQGFFLKAVAVYNQILKLDPRQVDVILKLAEMYRDMGKMAEAMQHYESVAAHFHREGNTKDALETVKKLVDLDPENIATRIKLAELYSKEGLVQDAIEQFSVACEHLRRVFTLDDQNVEAHERLKDIIISQGREQEAEIELLKLAELLAPADPDRAEQYLQELLAMNGTHTGAFELARWYRLRVARMSSVSSEVEYAGGGVAEVDLDGELELAPPSPMGIARGIHRDSVDEIDPD